MTLLRTATAIAVLIAGIQTAQAGQASGDPPHPTAAHYRGMLDRYCVSCHNRVLKTAGMVLETANVADVGEAPEIWERVVTKLSLSAMPPVCVQHPDASFY